MWLTVDSVALGGAGTSEHGPSNGIGVRCSTLQNATTMSVRNFALYY